MKWNASRTALDVQEVWQLPAEKDFNPLWRGAWCDGIGYAARGQGAIDLRAGKMLPVKLKVAHGGYSGAGAFVMGPALLTWNLYGGTKKTGGDGQAELVFCDRKTGAPLGVGHLPVNPPDGAPRE